MNLVTRAPCCTKIKRKTQEASMERKIAHLHDLAHAVPHIKNVADPKRLPTVGIELTPAWNGFVFVYFV